MVRTLRELDDPLGSYLRVTGRETTLLAQMLVDGRNIGTGLVADPALTNEQRDLWIEAHDRGVETVLDPRSLDLSTAGGFLRSGVQALPWAPTSPHRPADLIGPAGRRMCERIARAVADVNHSAVLAPTHLLTEDAPEWLDVDIALTFGLRQALDDLQLSRVPIYYPLIARGEHFYNASWRAQVVDRLAPLPIDGLWLRIHPFGTGKSGPLVLKRYLAACRDLHQMGLPLVGEHTGTIGIALMAFGAVGGIESGVTVLDHTDLSRWIKPPKTTQSGGAEARIYLQELGCFLQRSKADRLFERPGMKPAQGCRDTTCCPRGWRDTRKNYRQHFVAQRAREVSGLSRVPSSLRPGHYMESFLRPASDAAERAATAEPTLERVRHQLNSWRGTLGADLRSHSDFTFSPPAAGRRRRTA
ncbi:hypothetical protein [Mycolicibacterium moriokaense]|uniref:hypothetical protein n=1 Tax=Mycolicibacterium moriokaense TaxID=39691 RepID=UPI0011B42E7A|nr:hypothetical protein [Mycolicibacterium moriokaense]